MTDSSESPARANPSLGPDAMIAEIAADFGDAVLETKPFEAKANKDPWVLVDRAKVHDVLAGLRDSPKYAMNFLQDVTFFDLKGYPGAPTAGPAVGGLRLVYHLWSYPLRHAATLKCDLPRDDAEVRSACDLWNAANWLERELFDLAGIVFRGHPNLRRIMLPDEWEGYPLRKDYVEGAYALGIETTRENPLDLFGEAAVEE